MGEERWTSECVLICSERAFQLWSAPRTYIVSYTYIWGMLGEAPTGLGDPYAGPLSFPMVGVPPIQPGRAQLEDKRKKGFSLVVFYSKSHIRSLLLG